MSIDEGAERRRAGQPGPESTLLDRQAERAAIDQVLDAVRSGFSGTLVLRGGPGVGKTTLLRYAMAAAPDLRASSIAGVESEISIEYGGLHQLLRPFLPLLDDLPLPQRSALRVAFGQETGPPPERFLVALAALTLLSRAAQDEPLLCTIDDAHWLDPESVQALGFVSRRLYADHVGLISASNELVPSHKVVCHVGRQDGHIERVAGFDPALEIGSEGGFDHQPVAGRAFENRGNLFQNAARRRTGENPGLDGLCGNALRQRQCGKDGSDRYGRRCVVNLRPHGAFP